MPRRKMTEAEKQTTRNRKKHIRLIDQCIFAKNQSFEKIERAVACGLRQPTYFFKVGDRVKWGNWDWVAILEVHNLYYKVFRVTEDVRYGDHKGAKFEIDYLLWTEIRPYRTTEQSTENPRLEENEDIRFTYSQRDMRSLLHLNYHGSGLDLNPDYQRELVWTEDQKVALIESIFRNIDIGKFTIIRRPFRSRLVHYYEILDGKQRVQALMDFYECRFKYKGLTYNDLHWRDQIHFMGYSVNWAETEPLTDEQKYRYFLKLNVTGTPIDPKHIEKVKKLLENVNKS